MPVSSASMQMPAPSAPQMPYNRQNSNSSISGNDDEWVLVPSQTESDAWEIYSHNDLNIFFFRETSQLISLIRGLFSETKVIFGLDSKALTSANEQTAIWEEKSKICVIKISMTKPFNVVSLNVLIFVYYILYFVSFRISYNSCILINMNEFYAINKLILLTFIITCSTSFRRTTTNYSFSKALSVCCRSS